MTTYNDLFTLCPKPEEVITMDEAIVYNQEETINNYIITSKLEETFANKVFHNLTLENGKGFWVQGAYGSGKSHFMSFLTILLHEERFWDRLPDKHVAEYKEKISGKNFLTVNFTLNEAQNLRFKLFDEIERALSKKGHRVYIKNDKKIVDQFLRSEYAGLQKDWFYNILETDCGIEAVEWKDAYEKMDIDRLAEYIIIFKQATNAFSQKDYREVIYPGTNEGLQQVMAEVEKNYDGLVVFIDELSEFLQKQKSRGEESEVLETIMAIGERIRKSPIWVFAAVQKHPADIIDEGLYVSDEEEKVFDRFEPIVLSEADIIEIIDQRIIIKDERNRKSIGYIYDDLKEEIPHLEDNINKKEFIRQYPFHHEFINSMIHLSNYGSRQRAAIRECWEIANQRLNNPSKQLITIEVLYDALKEDVIFKYFKEYHDLYENVYREIIEKPMFEHDREMARRIMKTLVIYGVRNKELINARDIARLLMANLGLGMGLELINEDIHQTLMYIYREARGKGLHLEKKDSGHDVESHLWEIVPGSTGISVEPELLAEMRNINENDMAGRIPELINSNTHLFNRLMVDRNNSRPLRHSIEWRNTERKGLVLISNIKKKGKLGKIDPLEGEIDFGLLLGYPLFSADKYKVEDAKELTNKFPRYIIWVPAELKDAAYDQLRRYSAISRLLDTYTSPKNDTEASKQIQLETARSDLKNKLTKAIENCYFKGKIVYNDTVEENLEQYNGLDKLIQHAVNILLDEFYPEHPHYKRSTSRRNTNALIRDFIIPRVHKTYTNEIENVGEPFGLVKNNAGRFELDLNNGIFKFMEQELDDEAWHDVSKLYGKLRQEPWGLQDFSFEVVIAALIANGECRGKTKDGEIINSEKFTRNYLKGKTLINTFETISKGKMINMNIWNDTLRIMDILDIEYEDSKTITNQNKVWSRLVNKSLEKTNDIKSAHSHLLELGADMGQYDNFSKKLSIMKDMKEFFSDINEYKDGESSEGLREYRKRLLDKFSKIDIFRDRYIQVEKLQKLASERIDSELEHEYTYLNKIERQNDDIKDILQGFNNLSDMITEPTKLRSFLKKAKNIKDKYQETYIQAHNKYHREYDEFINKIRNTKAYKTLKILEGIKKVEVYPSLKDNMVNFKDNYLPQCNQINKTIIDNDPVCSCGFQPGTKFGPLSMNKVKEILNNTITSYFKKIKSENYYKQIELYLKENKDSDLRSIIHIQPYDIDSILNIVDERFVLELNHAFKMSYPVKISAKEITDMYRGTIPSKDIGKITEKVKRHLEEKIKTELADNEEIEYERVVLLVED